MPLSVTVKHWSTIPPSGMLREFLSSNIAHKRFTNYNYCTFSNVLAARVDYLAENVACHGVSYNSTPTLTGRIAAFITPIITVGRRTHLTLPSQSRLGSMPKPSLAVGTGAATRSTSWASSTGPMSVSPTAKAVAVSDVEVWQGPC